MGIGGNKVEKDRVVTKVSPSVPLVRVGNDGCLKCYFCSEFVFNLSPTLLSDLVTEVLGRGLLHYFPIWRQRCWVRDYVFLVFHNFLMKQVLKGILQIF